MKKKEKKKKKMVKKKRKADTFVFVFRLTSYLISSFPVYRLMECHKCTHALCM